MIEVLEVDEFKAKGSAANIQTAQSLKSVLTGAENDSASLTLGKKVFHQIALSMLDKMKSIFGFESIDLNVSDTAGHDKVDFLINAKSNDLKEVSRSFPLRITTQNPLNTNLNGLVKSKGVQRKSDLKGLKTKQRNFTNNLDKIESKLIKSRIPDFETSGFYFLASINGAFSKAVNENLFLDSSLINRSKYNIGPKMISFALYFLVKHIEDIFVYGVGGKKINKQSIEAKCESINRLFEDYFVLSDGLIKYKLEIELKSVESVVEKSNIYRYEFNLSYKYIEEVKVTKEEKVEENDDFDRSGYMDEYKFLSGSNKSKVRIVEEIERVERVSHIGNIYVYRKNF